MRPGTVCCYVFISYAASSSPLNNFFAHLYVYNHLQRRNLRIVYDAIGTLADAVGGKLNQVYQYATAKDNNTVPHTFVSSF